MSKVSAPRKSTLKKRPDRDSSIGDRVSDDEANRRRSCYQSIPKEKERQHLAANDIRKDKNQLGILRDILFNKRDINELIQKPNKSEKFNPKHNPSTGDGKNHSPKKTRSTSAKHLNSSGVIDWNHSEEDNLSANSADEEVLENEPVRLSRTNGKDDHQHPMIRSASLYSQSRQPPNGIRLMNNVSFMSDVSRNGAELNVNTSPDPLKKLLDRLSSELNDLELMTGFKPNKNDSSSNTCSTALATALITLTGHVKQCTANSKGKQEINNLKDQLSIVIKTQLDFQQKIENQMITLQTMMQTICQLVNNEIISNKKCEVCISRMHRDQTDFEIAEHRPHWLGNDQRSYILPKDTSNAMNELLMFSRRMNNGTPIDANHNRQLMNNSLSNRHSAYIETLEASKKLTRPSSSMSTNEINGNDMPKQAQHHTNVNQESRSSMISPYNTPLSYDMFESGLPTSNLLVNTLRNETGGFGGTSNTVPFPSKNETILEKILQERLRLVQQMAELNKQHNMTQEELAHLEAKTIQSRVT